MPFDGLLRVPRLLPMKGGTWVMLRCVAENQHQPITLFRLIEMIG